MELHLLGSFTSVKDTDLPDEPSDRESLKRVLIPKHATHVHLRSARFEASSREYLRKFAREDQSPSDGVSFEKSYRAIENVSWDSNAGGKDFDTWSISAILEKVLSSFARINSYTRVMNHICIFFHNIETRQREQFDLLLELELLEPMTKKGETLNKHRTELLENSNIFITEFVWMLISINKRTELRGTPMSSAQDWGRKSHLGGPDPFCAEVVIMSNIKVHYPTELRFWSEEF